jgi:hypothetical protein
MTLQSETRFLRKADDAQSEGTAIGQIFSEMRPRRKKTKSSLTWRFKAELKANRFADYPL